MSIFSLHNHWMIDCGKICKRDKTTLFNREPRLLFRHSQTINTFQRFFDSITNFCSQSQIIQLPLLCLNSVCKQRKQVVSYILKRKGHFFFELLFNILLPIGNLFCYNSNKTSCKFIPIAFRNFMNFFFIRKFNNTSSF